MHHIPKEDVRHILWSSLPRLSPLIHVKRSKGDPSVPSFLLDLIGKSCELEDSIIEKKPIRIFQPQSESRPVKVICDSGDLSLVKDVCDACQKGLFAEALRILDLYEKKDMNLEDAFHAILSECTNKKDLQAGRKVHSCVIRKGFQQNGFVARHLIKMFAMCGSLPEANHVFNNFLVPDTFTWSAIISAHAYLGDGKQALDLYRQMLKANVPPAAHTYMAVLKACSSIGSLQLGKIIHGDLAMEICSNNLHVHTMLIVMYAMCRSIADAWNVFNGIPQKDIIMCNVMMLICINSGDNIHALQILGTLHSKYCDSTNVVALILGVKACLQMKDKDSGKLLHSLITEHGLELNPYACSALMAMYIACGNLDETCNLFERLPRRTTVTWTFMIAIFSELNDYVTALKYFNRMQLEGIRPNDVTYLSILSACSHSGLLFEGHVVEAEDLLHAMPFKPDAIGCTALLSHHRIQGNVSGGTSSLVLSKDLDLIDASCLVMSQLYKNADW
ncbi:hypothetical protein KP509_26G001100 [Ceratopteris richardii]|uniref:Pentatricopeptide repeat-containing protein n=1 Tax=Ceratopteris richardii TaxID=49495 RepID=A0A8T2RJS2_CERRI|nr:hypothetical protein KP509_26G001100 [Ceratopteris richardii]